MRAEADLQGSEEEEENLSTPTTDFIRRLLVLQSKRLKGKVATESHYIDRHYALSPARQTPYSTLFLVQTLGSTSAQAIGTHGFAARGVSLLRRPVSHRQAASERLGENRLKVGFFANFQRT